MKRTIFSTAAVAMLLAGGAFSAIASETAADADLRARVVAKLEPLGYQVRKVELEDGEIEAYALKDGGRYEVFLDQALNILLTKKK